MRQPSMNVKLRYTIALLVSTIALLFAVPQVTLATGNQPPPKCDPQGCNERTEKAYLNRIDTCHRDIEECRGNASDSTCSDFFDACHDAANRQRDTDTQECIRQGRKCGF